MIVISDIVWDTDGDNPKDLNLPDEVRIADEMDIEDDEIADYLSDEYGFCVESFIIGYTKG